MSKAPTYPGDESITGSHNGMSQHDSSTGGESPEPATCSAPAVADREEKAVALSKFLVFIVLLVAVIGVATATYLLMENEERNDFEAAFAGLASEISTVAEQKIDQIYSALDAYSLFISSQVRADPNTSWPFVTVRDYSVKSEKIAELVGLEVPVFVFCPIVHEEDREQWPSFVLESAPIYYQESLDNEGTNEYAVEDLMNLTIPFLHVYGLAGPEEVQTPGPVLANWQQYPLEDPMFFGGVMLRGYNMLTLFPEISDQFEIAQLTLRPSISFIQFPDEKGFYVESQIMQPVIEDGQLVGVIILNLPWKEFFRNLNIDGLTDTIAVLRGNCNIGLGAASGTKNELSYLISSSSADFFGTLDTHNPKYDDLVVSQEVVHTDVEKSELPEGVCAPTLTLDLYPTEKLELSFQTSRPKLYAAVVVAIFVFTSLVFLLYDYLVGRRQRKFMARIMRQDQIVSDVFPAAIRDRLYEGEQKGPKQDSLLDPLGGGGNGTGGAPLADLFLETTVVFADIVGFTAWASALEPAQVFILLETVYGAFDKNAYRRSVFKVETVGDCYVAVAGLPEPSKDHAMAVCRFARDCVKTMKDTTLKLEVSLGPDTCELQLRVGIHSGQVTAGVLRGERSRFQLFGDTVNTAARMESTSARNRIQISQVTADLLVASGHSDWIAARKSKIFVKGKGEMQTYWLKTKAAKGSKPSQPRCDMPTVDETVSISSGSSSVGEASDNFDPDGVEAMTKIERLVEWNVE
eukprot:scaffold1246_cov134-Cylindrotheca_fusiformis.AAC.1